MAIRRFPVAKRGRRAARRGADGARRRNPVSRKAETQAFAISGPIKPRAKRDRIGVVMLASERSGQRLGDLRAAARRIAVGGDRDADPEPQTVIPRSARPSASGLGHQRPEARIIDAFVAVGAKVERLMALVRLASPQARP